MGRSIRIIRYDDCHRDQVAQLQRHHWHPDPQLNAAILDWKYRRNPYHHKAIHLAMDDDVAVGMRGLFGSRWQCDRRVYDVPSAGDLVIAPAYRNLGLFKQITDAAVAELSQSNVPFVFNFSSSDLTHLMSRSLGWRPVGDVENLIRMRGATTDQALTWRARFKRFDLAIKAVRWIRGARWATRMSPSPPFRHIDRAAAASHADPRWSAMREAEAMSQLVAEIAADGRIRHVRDAEYFTWRFQNPLKEYRFGYLGRSSLDGYIVLAADRYGDPQAGVTIVDWEARAPAVKEELLESAVSTGRLPLLAIWGAGLAAAERQMLERRGFRRSQSTATVSAPFRSILVCRTAASESWQLGQRNVLDRTNWDVRGLYSDGA